MKRKTKYAFVAGNHDFAFAAFLGCVPVSPASIAACDLDGARVPSKESQARSAPIRRFWAHAVEGGHALPGEALGRENRHL